MKKIFTLLFAAGIVTTSFAQTKHPTGEKKTATHSKTVSASPAKEKKMQVAKVHHGFDVKTKSTVSNRGISKSTKKPLIAKVQGGKTQKISKVNAKFVRKNNAAFNDKAGRVDTQKH